MCSIDDPLVTTDPMLVLEANARRNLGIAIARLALAPQPMPRATIWGL